MRKSAKSASIVKLQSLLELALNTDSHGEDLLFREDVKITMAGSGLYEWLLTVVNVSGVIGGEDGDSEQANGHAEHGSHKKEKDDKKPIIGTPFTSSSRIEYQCTHCLFSYRRFSSRLYGQISAIPCHFP